VARIDASLADIKAGRYEDAEAVAEKLRAKYGL
jgi:predicted transcriptional regulator